MSKPEIAAKSPSVQELEPGSFWWCQCGKSATQPWCDGSHKGSEFSPKEVVITEKKRYAMCQCKQTLNSPFCDGTHKAL